MIGDLPIVESFDGGGAGYIDLICEQRHDESADRTTRTRIGSMAIPQGKLNVRMACVYSMWITKRTSEYFTFDSSWTLVWIDAARAGRFFPPSCNEPWFVFKRRARAETPRLIHSRFL